MKQIIFSIIVLISNVLIAQNSFNYQLKSMNKVENGIKLSAVADFFKATSEPIDYIYQINNNKALFYPVIKIDNSQNKQIDLLKLLAETLGEYYYDYDRKIIENKIDSDGKETIVVSKFDEFTWVDTNNVEIIGGRNTKKYVNNRKEEGLTKDKIYTTTIWIDESYPQDIAPFGFMGMKGLIVKVNFNNVYELELQNFETKNIKNIQPYKTKNRISKEEFEKIIEKRNEEVLRDKR